MPVVAPLHSFYVRGIASLLWINEKIIFYPSLRECYKKAFKNTNPHIIVDIGANRGQSIRFFGSLFPEASIHSFEPNPSLYRMLVNTFQNARNHLYQMGVSNLNGKRTFYQHIFDETSGFEQIDQESSYSRIKNRVLLTNAKSAIAAQYEVPVITLDTFVENEAISLIDVLKIDVEGHEEEVLKGAFRLLLHKKIRYIQLERHFDNQYELAHNNIDALLAAAGYAEYFRKKHGFGNFYEVVYHIPSPGNSA